MTNIISNTSRATTWESCHMYCIILVVAKELRQCLQADLLIATNLCLCWYFQSPIYSRELLFCQLLRLMLELMVK